MLEFSEHQNQAKSILQIDGNLDYSNLVQDHN